ncbi:hypothetical protein E4T39_01922 [Aureobasidium subglaciale]|nr:hypothetical protein E4T39_01922 [Aureobasidium subglaciale]
MEFADYPGLNADLAADFHARHFTRRDTHMFSDHLGQMPHFNPAALAGLAVDVKPRLTKEQHDVLESEFRKQAKPNTNTKKRFAEILGVSLDKVNNWFQNRRAKSKQDAKKAAGAYNMLQATQQQQGQQQQQSFVGINPMGGINTMPGDQPFCMPNLYNGIRDNSIMDGPLSSGLGISQAESNFASLDQITSQPMRHQASTQSLASQHSVQSESFADNNRRTMTQAQFDAYAQPSFANMSTADVNTAMNSTANADFNYAEFCDFSFDQSVDPLTSPPMQSTESMESFAPDVISDFKLSDHQLRNASSSSEGSAPSVTISPAEDKEATFDMELRTAADQSSQQTVTSPQWQPGQSVPVEMDNLRKEFQEAAMRRDFSVQSIPDPNEYLDQAMDFPGDDYNRRESSTVQLARSMQSFTMAPQRSSMPSSSIAARRQRPRPAPLGTTNIRSTSYCGPLPTSPGPVGAAHSAGGHTLRRIKSSQAMNGIAGGRIQKNVGSAQRSPSGYTTFAEANNARYGGRRVSSFSPAYASLAASNVSLAPPTPMSPSKASRSLRQMQSQPMLRQTSLPEGEENYIVSSMNFSPPTTPLYGGQFIRSRMGSLAVPTENTPPQSAPPTQQCFPSGAFSPPHMSTMPMVQSQANPQGFLGMLPNEYPQMHNVMYPTQQQQNQYMDTQMSYIMTSTGEVIQGYPVMPPFSQGHMQQVTPPNQQQPFLPSSSLSPGVLGSSQVPKQHANSGADFFVHEYSPPRDVKNSSTPRKALESGPKNYTFSNHGPEYFEKNTKHKGSSSPASDSCDSVVA